MFTGQGALDWSSLMAGSTANPARCLLLFMAAALIGPCCRAAFQVAQDRFVLDGHKTRLVGCECDDPLRGACMFLQHRMRSQCM